jgi:mutator protein MutT
MATLGGPSQQQTAEQPRRRVGVVMAVGRSDGRWLMIRRSAQVSRAPLRVAFPGGEVEPGETQEQAVVREMREELGVRCTPLAHVLAHDLPDAPWQLNVWLARIDDAELVPDPREIGEVMWMTPEEGSTHPDRLPACGIFFEALARYQAQHPPAR